ncbi:MAG: hypothetical protein JJ975_13755 [Bacteroidia bacterium]|nr:hypothetical protein [Bacteroidia bacterium]
MLIALNAVLGLLVMLFPDGKRQITEAFSVQFVSASDLFDERNRVVVDLDTVLGDVDLSDTLVEEVVVKDTSFEEPELHKQIQFASNEASSLSQFFKALSEVENGSETLIRILHYGDSQLEGDRISDYLRNKMQNRFGGYGPGIVLPIDVSRARVSVRQSESKDWKKYAIYTRKKLDGGHYGIGGSSYKYTGKFAVKIGEDTLIQKAYDSLVVKQIKEKIEPVDSVKVDSTQYRITEIQVPLDSNAFSWDTVYKPIYESRDAAYSWLRYRCATRSYARVRTFNKVSLLYSSTDTSEVVVSVDGVDYKHTLLPKPYASKKLLHSGSVGSEVMLKFTGVSPTVLGVFLDGERGVAVDNFPMRGSSGTGYSTINQTVYRNQLSQSNARLIVMQYGINVVPNPVKNYDFYERMFAAQLKAIKKARPEVDILVIGPSDMSRKVAGEYVSYPNIVKIRDAMKKAAFDNGCAFWDLYSVMGGENSMVGWVNNKPALASKDYTHFNSRGARYIGEMLYNALMTEYVKWKSESN